MKNFFVKILCVSVYLSGSTTHAQTQYYLSSPIGYAAGVTGGGTPSSSNIVTVTTASALSSALSKSKVVILVSGSITTDRLTCNSSNISIIGLPGAQLINLDQTKDGSGILNVKSDSNVIIRNITFIGPGAYDVDGWDLLTNNGCIKLWVDHCEFQDGVDGNFDNTNDADNVTVSWCKFAYHKVPKSGGSGGSNDHRFCNLVGGSDSDTPEDGYFSITWLNCWWADSCVDRMARARNAKMDMLNCYWNSQHALKDIHLSPGDNGTYVYVANGVFKSTGKVLYFEETGNNNVKFVNCSGGGADTGSVSAPSYTWSSTSVDSVAAMVSNSTCGAGATLNVTSAGAISAGICAITEVKSDNAEKNYEPFFIDNGLNVNFPSACSEKAVITIYGVNGQKILSFVKKSTAKENIKQNLRRLIPGIYLVKIKDKNNVMSGKFLKKI